MSARLLGIGSDVGLNRRLLHHVRGRMVTAVTNDPMVSDPTMNHAVMTRIRGRMADHMRLRIHGSRMRLRRHRPGWLDLRLCGDGGSAQHHGQRADCEGCAIGHRISCSVALCGADGTRLRPIRDLVV